VTVLYEVLLALRKRQLDPRALDRRERERLGLRLRLIFRGGGACSRY
jgi:hypothetical protein